MNYILQLIDYDCKSKEESKYDNFTSKYLLAKPTRFNYGPYNSFFNAIDSFVDLETLKSIPIIRKKIKN